MGKKKEGLDYVGIIQKSMVKKKREKKQWWKGRRV